MISSLRAISLISLLTCLSKNILSGETDQFRNTHKTSYTILIYMAADNDLFPFAGRNIKQMQQIGSNDRVKILINFDRHRPGQQKLTQRLLIEKNRTVQLGVDMSLDSGDPSTLVNFCAWGIANYPADEYVLLLWNHGTGVLEPIIRRAINPSQLFNYNPETKCIELNRSIGFLDFISAKSNMQHRGICFDDTTRNYLTNSKLKEALHIIHTQHLKGKKFAIIACDACLMAMIEVVTPLHDYAHYFVGSQEVELGMGYNYTSVLTPFAGAALNKTAFAQHIVNSYRDAYSKITQDYTQSATDLQHIAQLESNISQIAQLLIAGLQNQKNKSVKEAIRLSRHRNYCTKFDEPSYIDWGHFCSNLITNSAQCELLNTQETQQFKQKLKNLLQQSLHMLSTIVIANTVGKNLKNAHGLSIYFPETQNIHRSYFESEFAKKTGWLNFILAYARSN